jgi:hypothetical protein
MKTLFTILALMAAFPAATCFAQDTTPAKFSLFKPVPKGQMREMQTDRPDVTESAYTVDAGHFQYETSLLNYTKQYAETSRTNTYTINELDFNLGLTGSTALQVMLDSYVIEIEREFGTTAKKTNQGIGELTLRLKQNLVGNNGGNFALALLPYVKLPTANYKEGNRTEAGLIVPMQIKLPAEWTLGTQVEVDRLQDDDEPALHTEFLQTLTLSHELFKDLNGIGETYYTYEFKKHEWTNYINAALQYSVNTNCKVDAGVNYGLQHEAERSFFLGMAFRF